MIGKGELGEQVEQDIDKRKIREVVRRIQQIPNNEIWKLYRISDVFVNLNEGEIFGMSILEAMYYECKVVALHAPGPDYIIENNISGYLAKDDKEVLDKILSNQIDCKLVKMRVIKKFVWKTTARLILNLLDERGC